MTLFNRKATVNIILYNNTVSPVGSLNIENLRISFQIIKSTSWSTNTCSLQIYNLKKDVRAQIKDFGDEISIFAGYQDNGGTQLLFVGDSTKVFHIFQQPEIITNIECGDGERILNQKIISVSYGSRISARSILRLIAQEIGVNIAFFATTEDKIYEQGFQENGLAKDILDMVCKYLDLTWSIQNKDLYLIKINESTYKPPYIISQNSGMISVPQRYTYKRRDLFRAQPRQGYKVRTLLRPEILPGEKITIISDQINLNETLYVDTVKHVGDTFGNTWESEIEAISL